MNHEVIPDPYYRDNLNQIKWVEAANWEYFTTFEVNPDLLKKKHIELIFEGLDTYASVYLNDALILQANNQFR